MRQLLFAAIADDFTGGSDLAGMLFAQGVRTVQTFGVPDAAQVALMANYDAVVVSLKTRSVAPGEAVAESLAAYHALGPLKPHQWQFKYCSTFDSTPQGNIGPVTAALMEATGVKFTIAVPALPVNGRTQYCGNLFVLGVPLAESPMRTHPLNPMTDSNLERWLQQQTTKRVGLLPWPVVAQSALAIAKRAGDLEQAGVEIVLVDAITDEDLSRIAEAFSGHPFLTGGSGLAMHLPQYWTGERAPILTHAPAKGPGVILCGSCSAATLAQLDNLRSTGAAVMPYTVSPAEVDAVLAHGGLVALASSAPPEGRTLGAERDIEQRMGEWARHFVNERGVRRLVVAGGETSGAVVEALGIKAVELTSILDPGVPALRTIAGAPLSLALKSGNFGSQDFFTKALSRI